MSPSERVREVMAGETRIIACLGELCELLTELAELAVPDDEDDQGGAS